MIKFYDLKRLDRKKHPIILKKIKKIFNIIRNSLRGLIPVLENFTSIKLQPILINFFVYSSLILTIVISWPLLINLFIKPLLKLKMFHEVFAEIIIFIKK